MAEYIERETLLERAEYDNNYRLIIPAEAIKAAPAADVAPVVHGWWLTWEEQFPGRTLRTKSMLGVFCSACHNHADNMFNYCPNCGAKMDLEEEHGQGLRLKR